jgi:hypothetical protein
MNIKHIFLIISLVYFTQSKAQYNGVSDHNSDYAINSIAGVTNFKNLFVYDFGVNLTKAISEESKINFSLMYRTSAPILDQNWGRYAMVMKSSVGSAIVNFRYDIFPFIDVNKLKFLRNVKLTAGLQYVENPVYSFRASLRDAVKWGQLTFTQDEVGYVDLVLKTNQIQPTFGIGYDEFYLNKRISIGFDAGGVYNGYPNVEMRAHNMLEQTVNNAPRLQYNLRSYNVIPYLQLNLQYHL